MPLGTALDRAYARDMSEPLTLTLGHSPDPDDAFMFYGLAKGLIPTPGLRFEHILQDIQTLNERATRGELDISAISIHAYAHVSDTYALLPSGALLQTTLNGLVMSSPSAVAPAKNATFVTEPSLSAAVAARVMFVGPRKLALFVGAVRLTDGGVFVARVMLTGAEV